MSTTSTSTGDQIALRDIDSVLRQMWRDSADDEQPITQVRTLNLLIFVPAPQHDAALQRTIDELAVRHPGRTITLIAHEGAHPAYGQASLACRIGDGDKHMCGEQITLYGGDGGASLFSTAAALLLPDLPVFLWWLGDPPVNTPLFDDFVELADRLLVDARTWHNADTTLPELAQLIAHMPRFACTDVVWTSLTSWRQSIAQCFDPPANQDHLHRLERVTITHGPNASDVITAQLIVGWLGSRLGWQVDGTTVRRADGTPVVITLREQQEAGLDAVELRSDDGAFAITRRQHSACADVQIAVNGAAPMHFVVPRKTPALVELIGEELIMLQRDEGYEAALQFAARLARQ